MESRCRLALNVACSCLAISTAGCSDALNAGPLEYEDNETLTKVVGNNPNLADKPKLQNAVRQALAELYGPSPQEIRVPQGAPLPNGGIPPCSRLYPGFRTLRPVTRSGGTAT